MGVKQVFLPDFIIIGANKAGTTSVANYLNQNPHIKISDVKEPMFFSSTPKMATAKQEEASLAKPFFAITLDEYSSMFKNCTSEVKFFGEASTAYLANPYTSASLIKKIVPDVKIIAALREPVSRAISAYKMCVGNGIENRPFKDVVKASESQKTILKGGHSVKEYFRNGLYAQLLEPYFTLFNPSQLLILDYDELKQHPERYMTKVSDFIGTEYYPVNLDEKFNTASEFVKTPSKNKAIESSVVFTKIKEQLKSITKKEVVIDMNSIEKLHKLYEKELVKLQSMIDIDISSWMIKKEI